MVKHGVTAYKNGRCRCRVCRAAAVADHREWANRSRMVDLVGMTHGTISTYNNYGCRCEPCRAAKSDYNRQRPSRAKAGVR